jgi:hypothetical protein
MPARTSVNNGQYRLSGIKYEHEIHESCSDYSGTQTFNSLEAKEGDGLVPVRTYKQLICKDVIFGGMRDIFRIPDLFKKQS